MLPAMRNCWEDIEVCKLQAEASIRRVRQIGFHNWRLQFEWQMLQAALIFDFETSEMEDRMTSQDLAYRRHQIVVKCQQDLFYLEFVRERSQSEFQQSRFREMLQKP